ncbi:MAG: hypothetical protein ACO1RX_16440 [Candidatus Sericytochromatia bacterium]
MKAKRHPLLKTVLGSLLLGAVWVLPVSADVADSLLPGRIARFNRSILDQNPGWRQYPLLMALQWVGLEGQSAHRQIDSQGQPVENPRQITISVMDSGLLDDSVAARRTVLVFERQDWHWQLRDVEESWRCQRGADTQQFHQRLCP